MALIGPDGFLTNKNSKAYSQIRKYLTDNANLESVISLPRGSFEPYNRAKASIMYFTNVKKPRKNDHYFYFQVRNDGYTLDKKRRRVEGVSDLELVLSEKNLSEQNQNYLLDLGISRLSFKDIAKNEYVLNAAPYLKIPNLLQTDYPTVTLGKLIKPADKKKVGNDNDIPVMSITMKDGLIDQVEKFNKRIASANISKYNKVGKNELVMGFPIDEGVLGFQKKYTNAAVSPAYKVWKLIDKTIDVDYLEMVLRSEKMRSLYRLLMQGAVDRRRSVPDDIFLKIEIPLPGTKIQKKIVKKHFETISLKNKIKELEGEIQNEITNLWE